MGNFTQLTNSLNIIQALSDLPNQTDNLTASQLKAKFDEAVNIIKTYINSTLITELQASGGADKLGALVGGVASNIQTFINNVETAGTGNLPPAGSVTNVMLATDVKVGSLASLTTTNKSSVQSAINEINAKQTPADILTTEGDLMYRNATTPTRLAKGNTGELLRMNSSATAPEWMTLGTAYQGLNVNANANGIQWLPSIQSILTTQGDLLYASNPNSPARLAKGNVGAVLKMKSDGTAPEWLSPDATKNKALITTGSNIAYGIPDPGKYSISDTVILTANTERSTNSTGYTGLKSFTLSKTGNVRVKGEYKTSTNGTAFLRIYNSTQALLISSEISTASTNYISFSLDASIGTIRPGDVITIDGKTSNGAPCFVRNVTVCATESIINDSITD
jgi:hypothetical protein